MNVNNLINSNMMVQNLHVHTNLPMAESYTLPLGYEPGRSQTHLNEESCSTSHSVFRVGAMNLNNRDKANSFSFPLFNSPLPDQEQSVRWTRAFNSKTHICLKGGQDSHWPLERSSLSCSPAACAVYPPSLHSVPPCLWTNREPWRSQTNQTWTQRAE